MNVAPQPAPALDQEVPHAPRRGDFRILMKPAPPQPGAGRALAEHEIFRSDHRPVPGHDCLSLSGYHQPFPMDMNRAAEETLKHRAVHKAGMSADVVGMAGGEVRERARRVVRARGHDSLTDVVVSGEGTFDVATGQGHVVIVEDDLYVSAVKAQILADAPRILQGACLLFRLSGKAHRDRENAVCERI